MKGAVLLKNKIKIGIITLCFAVIMILSFLLIKNDRETTSIDKVNLIETPSKTLRNGDKEDIVVVVNDKEIRQLDVNYRLLINQNIKQKYEDTDLAIDYEGVKDEIINQEILLQEAKKNNVDIDETEKKLIKETYTNAMSETDRQIAQEIGMTEEEFLQYAIEKQTENRIAEKMREKIIRSIVKGEIKLEDDNFNKKMQEVQETLNYNLLQETYEIYISYLKENSNINYIK